MVGYLDSVRLSNSARYTGGSFAAPSGDLGNDANTLLLYNFNEAPGSTTVADGSSNGWTGTLGDGFDGATSPQLMAAVPEPSTLAALGGLLGMGLIGRSWRRRKAV